MVGSEKHITHEEENNEAWICLCGNRPDSDSFFPCDKDGNEMEPAEGWAGLYVCARCGRIIDQDSLEVVDQNPNFRRLD
jgi:hypothetical protein